tara:strand:+ start:1238 stop:3526 length:2289 start_codon:yes stop_codon:yes gene_type:complete
MATAEKRFSNSLDGGVVHADLAVIIPTFNRSKTIKSQISNYINAITIALEKYDKTAHFIIVDDCSTDDTLNVLIDFLETKQNLEIVSLAKNSGPGIARNIGVSKVKSDWIWFLDDDDDLNPKALDRLLQNLDGSYDILAHSLKKRNQSETDSSKSKFIASEILMFREHQEVFNYIFKSDFYRTGFITFAPGLHEDISVVVECLLKCENFYLLDDQVVIKAKGNEAITSQFNTSRIDGYITAYYKVTELLKRFEDHIEMPTPLEIYTQFLGVILYLIAQEDTEKARILTDHLIPLTFSKRFEQQTSEYCNTDTNFKFACKVWSTKSHLDPETFISVLKNVFAGYLSCKDLNSSLFLGPNEIRACCKRFFVNGTQKGDVVLLKASEDTTYSQISSAKHDLIQRINSGNADECFGCPYINRYEKPVVLEKIDYLSFENFSYCNMRCTYCSPKYYGGTEAVYDALAITQSIALETDQMANNAHVVWGGGEPTLSPRFKGVNEALQKNPNIGKVRVLSNSLKYSKNLETLLLDDRYHLVTSIDAGTQNMFAAIRQRGEIETVLKNLVAYKKVLPDPKRLTIKYIVTAENYTSLELEAFVERLQQHSLLDCLLQISCDFTVETAYENMICALYELGARLFEAGASFVFFDDLIRDRVTISEALEEKVRNHFNSLKLSNQYLLIKPHNTSVLLWGKGLQSDWYKNSTQFGINGKFNDTVRNVSQLDAYLKISEDKKFLVFPSGVQSYYEIIEEIIKAGKTSELTKALVL